MGEPRIIVRWVMRGWQDFTLDEVRARFPNAPRTNDTPVWVTWLADHRTRADRSTLLAMVEWDGIASDSTTVIEVAAIDLSRQPPH